MQARRALLRPLFHCPEVRHGLSLSSLPGFYQGAKVGNELFSFAGVKACAMASSRVGFNGFPDAFKNLSQRRKSRLNRDFAGKTCRDLLYPLAYLFMDDPSAGKIWSSRAAPPYQRRLVFGDAFPIVGVVPLEGIGRNAKRRRTMLHAVCTPGQRRTHHHSWRRSSLPGLCTVIEVARIGARACDPPLNSSDLTEVNPSGASRQEGTFTGHGRGTLLSSPS
jgi:hypothetical protein